MSEDHSEPEAESYEDEDGIPRNPKDAYELGIDLVGYLLEDVLEDARRDLPEAVDRDELIHYLRVRLGLVGFHGPHGEKLGLQKTIESFDF